MFGNLLSRRFAFLVFPDGIQRTLPSSSMSRLTRAATSLCRSPR